MGKTNIHQEYRKKKGKKVKTPANNVLFVLATICSLYHPQ
jgi:hypothetical protein